MLPLPECRRSERRVKEREREHSAASSLGVRRHVPARRVFSGQASVGKDQSNCFFLFAFSTGAGWTRFTGQILSIASKFGEKEFLVQIESDEVQGHHRGAVFYASIARRPTHRQHFRHGAIRLPPRSTEVPSEPVTKAPPTPRKRASQPAEEVPMPKLQKEPKRKNDGLLISCYPGRGGYGWGPCVFSGKSSPVFFLHAAFARPLNELVSYFVTYFSTSRN